MNDGNGWTVVSDQQKGLVPAIHEVWPAVEHRQCARHIYSNWRKIHSGRVLQSQFWKCVKATSMPIFQTEAAKLRIISEQAYEDFMARDPNTFCKSHFKCHSKCDVVDNNMAETFNSFILLARYKPIVSMLEDIRLSIMDRMQEKKKLVSKFVGGVAPRIHKKLEEAYQEQVHCRAHWNGDENETGFEIIHRGQSHAVDLKNMTCTCRNWDLTGIPCPHAVSAILLMRRKPEIYLSEMYSQENYLIAYGGMLNPVQGSNYWDTEGEGMVLPPNIIRRPKGRPKTARRRDPSEGSKHPSRSSRQGLIQKCSNCHRTGHRRPSCPDAATNPPRPAHQQENQSQVLDEGTSGRKKRGRPKGSKTRPNISIEEHSQTNTLPPSQVFINKRSMARATIIQESTPISTQDVHQEEHTQASCAHNSGL
ncbi:uncharacterized protein LOC109827591 isoform X2 [Asparagus officinalis]|uniref:uncharacterized protein LOC109827591 isoform X2 n=1 Tax=Asparagus officinalis TaxID=4686 RepID=UPI00098E54B9|nr:uncharacterized protein LOC109827591 isoform X2 [Asparagus officinalis]